MVPNVPIVHVSPEIRGVKRPVGNLQAMCPEFLGSAAACAYHMPGLEREDESIETKKQVVGSSDHSSPPKKRKVIDSG